jgi:hypothetical protein
MSGSSGRKKRRVRCNEDLTGRTFCRLTVVGLDRSSNYGRFWIVRCSCGEERRVRTAKLLNGEHKSCGCMRRELMANYLESKLVRVVDGMKACCVCKKVLPESSFYTSTKTHSGLNGRCIRCHRKRCIQSEYGLSAEFAEKVMTAIDSGVCSVCGRSSKLHIDHDHKSGKFRGLLCGNCNRALGLMFDDPVSIGRLAAYVENTRNPVLAPGGA